LTKTTFFQLLADAILIIHLLFVGFVVLGLVFILIGMWKKWPWVHNRIFRITHLIAIGIVVAQAWLDRLCPLTLWENELREKAGEAGYSETFIEHWLHEILFYQAEPWVFTTLYTCFGALVVLVWFLGRRSEIK
jgi:hypothetical protein